MCPEAESEGGGYDWRWFGGCTHLGTSKQASLLKTDVRVRQLK